MKILLLKNIPKVGKKDEVVEVADGYATNVLFVQKSAIPATKKAIEDMEKRIVNKQTHNQILSELFEKEIARIGGTVTITVKANEKGSLFSRVDERAIVKALKDARISLDEKNIFIKNEIKEIGTHTVDVSDGVGKKYSLTVTVQT
jgi:large subunit ribosomal protein L9